MCALAGESDMPARRVCVVMLAMCRLVWLGQVSVGLLSEAALLHSLTQYVGVCIAGQQATTCVYNVQCTDQVSHATSRRSARVGWG
jgi:hypothetical protein